MYKLNKIIKVTHQFHPQNNKEFELVNYRKNWGHTYIDYYNESGEIDSIPLEWTDACEKDPFNELSKGCSIFRISELLRLIDLINDFKSIKNSIKIRD